MQEPTNTVREVPVSNSYHTNAKLTALVVYYSPASRGYLETLVGDQGIQVQYVAGREADAVALVQQHPAGLVVIDSDSRDISIYQAVRQIGRLLPHSLVFTVHQRSKATVYLAGHLVGQVENSSIAHFADTFEMGT